MVKTIENLIKRKKIKVGVMGLGYVGLPLAVEFARGGFETTGFEMEKEKVLYIMDGESYIPDVQCSEISALVKSGGLKATWDFSKLKLQDAIIICVPTPLRKTKDPDVSFIITAAKQVSISLRKSQMIILESTTYPGTTRELVKPILEESGLKAGKDFFLSFSPERVDPGNKKYGIKNTPKIIGGITPECEKISSFLYSQIISRIIPVSNSETAELVKLLENTFRAVNIAMINEIALMCHKLKIDVWEVIEAASTKPFGFMPFYPGPGIGGHCLPLDPQYLAWKMKSLNFEPRFVELAEAINSKMPEHVVSRVTEILNSGKKPLKSSRLLLIGMAYKPDISDARESPAKDLFALFKEAGAFADYHDPYVPEIEIQGKTYCSKKITGKTLKNYDCTIIATPHSGLDYAAIVKNSKRIFDARNALKIFKSKNIWKL
ncbi:MAG: nucleotide sugar dehydrogenase [Elusimicrobia bacterium]|nr:nucleotide sugar dehydrogenase [Elusimicrobiota bacterium]